MIQVMSARGAAVHNGVMQTILAIDDTPAVLASVHAILKDTYRVLVANRASAAQKLLLAGQKPDLILLDVVMPELDGYEMCRWLQDQPELAQIPVLFLTARTDPADEVAGFEAGAVDYITKPISPLTLQARVRTHLTLVEARRFLAEQNQLLEERVQERTREIAAVQEAALVALGSLAETRDNETGNHIRRTQRYVQVLAGHPSFQAVLTPEKQESIYRSAPLHDIGKVGIPDRILLKPGRLTPEEFSVMQTHPRLGRDAILAAEKLLDSHSDFLVTAREIAYSHHEKWDGTGYPEGLAGEAIPLAARLMAVADVYDALISKRVYKDPMPHEQAVEIIRQGRGCHFDPVVVDAFLDVAEEFRALSVRYADQDDDVRRKARLEDLVV